MGYKLTPITGFILLATTVVVLCWCRWLHKSSTRNISTQQLPPTHVETTRTTHLSQLIEPVVISTNTFKSRYCIRTTYSIVGLQDFRMCLHPNGHINDPISNSIRSTGSWEHRLSRLIFKYLKIAGPDPTFIDIGANIGSHSLAMAAMGYPVVAVEPNPINAKRLVDSIRANDFQSLITLFVAAVSDSYTNLQMAYSINNIADSYAVKSRGSFPIYKNEKFTAPTMLLDDLVPYSGKNAIVKMDIQNHECNAIELADNLLGQMNIPCIMMEWHMQSSANVTCVQSMVDKLHAFNFVAIDQDGNVLDQHNWLIWPYDIMWRRRRIGNN